MSPFDGASSMNNILVFTEKKDFEGIFKGLYGPNGFQVRTFGPEDEIRITEDDHFVVIHPGRKRASLSKVIDEARKRISDLKVICVSMKKTSAFSKQFDPKDVDAHFTEKTTVGEIQESVRRLIFPEKYEGNRTEPAGRASEFHSGALGNKGKPKRNRLI